MHKKIRTLGLLAIMGLGVVPFGAAQAQTPPPAPTATSVPASGVTLYALTTSNKLLRFNAGAPGTIETTVQIGGLQSGEDLVGIDFRPATGQLFGLGSNSRLYTIDTASGAATAAANVLTTTLSGANFGFDFNPVVDRIRVTSDEDQDLRLNPNNGGIAAIDGTLTYTSTDRNAGQNPNVFASAYTNNFPGPASTTLYNLDSNLDVLVTQAPPNSGTLNTVGALGVDVTAVGGFDIVGANTAFAALSMSSEPNNTGLYTINLATGAATMVGVIGGGESVRGLSAALSASPATVTPVPATATTTATAQASATAQATTEATMQATMEPTSLPATTATSLPAAPTQVMEPTVMPTMVEPTQAIPGMPSTGQADAPVYVLFALMALLSIGIGWTANRRTASNKK